LLLLQVDAGCLEEAMNRIVLLTALLSLFAGCTPTSRIVEVTNLLEAKTPADLENQPVLSAELAGYMAELVLAEKGIDCRKSQTWISFCEGVYTVAFYSFPGMTDTKFTVRIDAKASTILSIKKTEKKVVTESNLDPA
jgi:hypothetical protein